MDLAGARAPQLNDELTSLLWQYKRSLAEASDWDFIGVKYAWMYGIDSLVIALLCS